MTVMKLGNRFRKVLIAYNDATSRTFPDHEAIEETKQGLRVTVTKEQAANWATYLVESRTWSDVGFTFGDDAQRRNVLRDLFNTAQKFAEVAGQQLDKPSRRNAKQKGDDLDTSVLPQESIDDLEKGDEILVVRHLTRYGLNTIERWPARVEGRAQNGDYWVTSLEDSTSRACRPTEVIVVKRASQEVK